MSDAPLGVRAALDSPGVRPVVVGALALFAFVGVGAAAYFLAGGGTGTEAAIATATTTQVSGAVGPDGGPAGADEVVTVEILGLAFELPPGWVVAAPGAGATGSQLIDEPEAAERFDVLLAQQDADTVLFGLDTMPGSQTTLNVVIQSLAPDAGFEALVASGRTGFTTQPNVVLDLDDEEDYAGSPGHVFRYRFDNAGRPAHGLQFLVQHEGQVYIVTLSSTDVDAIDRLESIGETFAPV